MKYRTLCRNCRYFKVSFYEPYRGMGRSGYPVWFEGGTSYLCKKTYRVIRTLRNECKDFMPNTQTILNGGGIKMVKIDVIPSEGERWELEDLPHTLDCKAVSEKVVGEREGKAGGLQIDYIDTSGKGFTQKYTLVSGAVLANALRKLKLTDTEQLQDAFYTYELTAMRIGKPRMIPISKVK